MKYRNVLKLACNLNLMIESMMCGTKLRCTDECIDKTYNQILWMLSNRCPSRKQVLNGTVSHKIPLDISILRLRTFFILLTSTNYVRSTFYVLNKCYQLFSSEKHTRSSIKCVIALWMYTKTIDKFWYQLKKYIVNFYIIFIG